MTLYLVSFLVFLGTAAALAASKARGEGSGGHCGDCSARKRSECNARSPAEGEVR